MHSRSTVVRVVYRVCKDVIQKTYLLLLQSSLDSFLYRIKLLPFKKLYLQGT